MAEPLAFLGIFIIVIVIPMLIAWKMPRKQRRYSVKTGQKMSLARRPFSADTKRIVLSAQGHKCNICQCNLMFQGITEFDHKNGDNSDNISLNCQALCANCHRRKTNEENSFRNKGY